VPSVYNASNPVYEPDNWGLLIIFLIPTCCCQPLCALAGVNGPRHARGQQYFNSETESFSSRPKLAWFT